MNIATARTILIALLALTIPLSGTAGFEVPVAECPMDMAQPSTANAMTDAADHFCCEDPETAALTGKLCKTGQECGTASLFYVPAGSSLVIPRTHVSLAGDSPPLLIPAPSTLLRPPRA